MYSWIQILIRLFLFMLCEDMIGSYCSGYGWSCHWRFQYKRKSCELKESIHSPNGLHNIVQICDLILVEEMYQSSFPAFHNLFPSFCN